jgi:hypothetical protein
MESKRFAWWPIKVTSGKRVWMKAYYEHTELYDKNTGRAPITSFTFTWTETAAERTWRMLRETAVQNRNVWNEYNYTKEDQL